MRKMDRNNVDGDDGDDDRLPITPEAKLVLADATLRSLYLLPNGEFVFQSDSESEQ